MRTENVAVMLTDRGLDVRTGTPEGTLVCGSDVYSSRARAKGVLSNDARKRVLQSAVLVFLLGSVLCALSWSMTALIVFRAVQGLGIGGLSWSTFTEMTPPPMAETGGLANAIFGSLMMVGLATLVGTPIGILAGIYLGEYGQKTWLGSATRFINDILLSAPSIVIGLFIYSVVVSQFAAPVFSHAVIQISTRSSVRCALWFTRPGSRPTPTACSTSPVPWLSAAASPAVASAT